MRARFELLVSWIGGRLGNLNDLRAHRGTSWDSNRDAPRSYRVLDRIAGRLYTFGER